MALDNHNAHLIGLTTTALVNQRADCGRGIDPYAELIIQDALLLTAQTAVATVEGDTNTVKTNATTVEGNTNTVKTNATTVEGNTNTDKTDAAAAKVAVDATDTLVDATKVLVDATDTAIDTVKSNTTTATGNFASRTATQAAVDVLVADGVVPTQAHVNDLVTAWNAFKTNLTTHETSVTTADTNATTAVSSSQSTQTSMNSTVTASQAGQTATNLVVSDTTTTEANANTLLTNATTAEANGNTLLTNATTAEADANTALTDVNLVTLAKALASLNFDVTLLFNPTTVDNMNRLQLALDSLFRHVQGTNSLSLD